jgi:hypothetical protein
LTPPLLVRAVVMVLGVAVRAAVAKAAAFVGHIHILV